MKQTHLDDLRGAGTGAELLQAIESVAESLDFNLAAMAVRQGSLSDAPHIKSVSNHPPDWHAGTDLEFAVVDPVFVRLQNTIEPFFYDQDFYLRAGCIQQWEENSAAGFVNGVSASLPLSGGKHLFWGFDRREPLPADERQRTQLLASTQLVGVFAAVAAERILGKAQPLLTDQQLAVLRYTWQGHSSWKISRFMEIGEDCVNYHLKQIRARLGVASKHQAVLKALSLGLLV